MRPRTGRARCVPFDPIRLMCRWIGRIYCGISTKRVGAYLGPTPCRYQSVELGRKGRISKRGDRLTQALPVRGRNRPAQRGAPPMMPLASPSRYQPGKSIPILTLAAPRDIFSKSHWPETCCPPMTGVNNPHTGAPRF